MIAIPMVSMPKPMIPILILMIYPSLLTVTVTVTMTMMMLTLLEQQFLVMMIPTQPAIQTPHTDT